MMDKEEKPTLGKVTKRYTLGLGEKCLITRKCRKGFSINVTFRSFLKQMVT